MGVRSTLDSAQPPLDPFKNDVQVLLELGEEQGHVWDGAAGGPSGLTPLHIAAARPGGSDLALLLANRTAPGACCMPDMLPVTCLRPGAALCGEHSCSSMQPLAGS